MLYRFLQMTDSVILHLISLICRWNTQPEKKNRVLNEFNLVMIDLYFQWLTFHYNNYDLEMTCKEDCVVI
jgi:hypothetical protein